MHGQGKPNQPEPSRPGATSNGNRAKQIYNRNLLLKIVRPIGHDLLPPGACVWEMHPSQPRQSGPTGRPRFLMEIAPKQISITNLLSERKSTGFTSPLYRDLGVKLFHILSKWSTATLQYATIPDMILHHSIGPEMLQLLLSPRKYAIARLFVKTVHLSEKLKYKFDFSASLCQSFLCLNMSIRSILAFSASSR